MRIPALPALAVGAALLLGACSADGPLSVAPSSDENGSFVPPAVIAQAPKPPGGDLNREVILPYGSGPGNPAGFAGWSYIIGGPDVGLGSESPSFPDPANGTELWLWSQFEANGAATLPFWYDDPNTPCRKADGSLPVGTPFVPFTDLVARAWVTLPPGTKNVQVHASYDNLVEVSWDGVKVSGGSTLSGDRYWETMSAPVSNRDGTFTCFQEDMAVVPVPGELAAVPSNAEGPRTFLLVVRLRDLGYESYLDVKVTAERGFVPDPDDVGSIALEVDWYHNDPGTVAPINLAHGEDGSKDNGLLPVTILGGPDLDLSQVDPRLITLGNGDGVDTPVALDKRGQPMASLIARGREAPSLRVFFDLSAMIRNGDLALSTTELCLTGVAPDGATLFGRCQPVRVTVPPSKR